MKKKNRFSIYALMVVLFILTNSCKKEQQLPVPVLTTTNVSGIIQNTAISGGTITNEGGSTITSRGVCWSTKTTPTITDSKTIDGAGAGSFSSKLTELSPATIYFVRAYATNSQGTGYGSAMSFTSHEEEAPILETSSINGIKYTSVTCGGNITYDGGSTITSRGVCWSTKKNPKLTDSKNTDGVGEGIYSSNLLGLNVNTEYYVRAYATNNAGIGYGDAKQFTTASITVPVNIQLYPNSTSNYIPVGGWIYLEGGNRGIIVYRILPEQFMIYERRCPYDPDNENSMLQIDPLSKIALDSDCGSRFTLTNGNPIQGPSTSPLQQYHYSYNGELLQIYY